ncbi:MAG: DUF4118 domain-containing protein [Devosia sp.]
MPVAAVTAITLVGQVLYAVLPLQNLSMLYLVAVVVCGILRGRISAIAASLLSFLAYNFFFIEPLYTFTVAKPHELFALAIFLAAALFTGNLAGRMREQAERSRRQEQATQALYEFSRKLAGAVRLDTVLDATAAHLYAALGQGAVLLVPDAGELVVGTIWPPDLTLSPIDMTAARWAFDKRELAGNSTGTLPQIPWQFRPIIAGRAASGVLGLVRPPSAGMLLPHEEQIVRGVLEQAAIAMDRARLVRENARTVALEESERLNSALFASLSHDLKTPLATISGATTSLRDLGDKMDPATRSDLLLSIEEEASRLARFVANLFDMTRIEAATLKPRKDRIDIGEVVSDTVERARRLHPDSLFELSLAPDLPAARGDATLLGQALFNLLDNASKYAGEAPIALFARGEDDQVVISVTDQGKGIPERDLERIFDKFFRRTKGDGRSAGTGLGLSIARGFVAAMGGSIKAESPAVRKRGTRFTIRVPMDREVSK